MEAVRVCFRLPRPVRLFHSGVCLFSCGPGLTGRYPEGYDGKAAARLCHRGATSALKRTKPGSS